MNLARKLVTVVLSAAFATTSAASGPDWQWIRPTPHGNDIDSMATSPNIVVAVGTKGMITHTNDGVRWHVSDSSTTEDVLDVVHWEDSFLAITKRGRILRSNDGISWTNHKPFADSTTAQWMVSLAGRCFVSVDYKVHVSDDGLTWTSMGLSEEHGSITEMTYGNGLFLARLPNNNLLTSTNAKDWNPAGHIDEIDHMGFDAPGSRFFIATTSWKFFQSANGTNWVPLNHNVPDHCVFATWVDGVPVSSTDPIRSVIGFNGIYLAAGAGGLTARSANGATWLTDPPEDPKINCLEYFDGKHHLLGDDGLYMTSTDGTRWESEMPFTSEALLAYTKAEGIEMIVGKKTLFRRQTGHEWQSIDMPYGGDVEPGSGLDYASIIYGNGVFLLTGYPSTASWDIPYFTSPDGITWTSHTCQFWLTEEAIFANGKFYSIIYNNPGVIVSSPDGITWTSVSKGAINYPTDISYGNGVFVVTSESGWVLRSTNGENWTAGPASSEGSLLSVAYGNGAFYVAGSYYAASSADGLQWNRIDSLSGEWNSHISAGESNTLIASGSVLGSGMRGSDFGWTYGMASPSRTYYQPYTVHSGRPTPTGSHLASGSGITAYGVDGGLYYSKDATIWKFLNMERKPYGWYEQSGYNTVGVNGKIYAFPIGSKIYTINWADSCLEIDDNLSVSELTLPMEGYASAGSTGDRCFVSIYNSWAAGGSVLYTSADMRNWTRLEHLGINHLKKVVTARQKYLVLMENGGSFSQVYDKNLVGGATKATPFLSVESFKDQFYAVSRNQITTSIDGENWTTIYTATNVAFTEIVASPEKIIVLLEGGGLLHSNDGVNWDRIFAPCASPFVRAHPIEGAFLFMTDIGELLVSRSLQSQSPGCDIAVEQPLGTNLIAGDSTVDFGRADFGASVARTITIRNSGTLPLTGLSVEFREDSGIKDFTLGPLEKTSLMPAEATTIDVIFSPTPYGYRKASIRIKSNDSDEDPFDITLVGAEIERPEIAVWASGNYLWDGNSSVAFGAVALKSSATVTFEIRNWGTGSLKDLRITKDGKHAPDFAVSTPLNAQLDPDDYMIFEVKFKPSAIGNRTATIHIASNDADENPFDITLTGAGIGDPDIAVQQPAGTNLKDGVSIKEFGSVALKSSLTKTFTIKNTGTANLTGLSITKTGSNSKDFSVKAPLKTSLAPGASTSFKVTFNPSAKGTLKAAIHIKSNDSNENPFDIALTGKGIAKSAAPSALAQTNRALSRPDHGVRQSIDTVRRSDGRKYLMLTVRKSPETLLRKPTVEVSPNLIDWYSGKNHTTVITDDESRLKVRDNTPLSQGTKRYIRINTSELR